MSEELLCQSVCSSAFLRGLCPHGAVCAGQCGGGRAHEAPGGVSQAGQGVSSYYLSKGILE